MTKRNLLVRKKNKFNSIRPKKSCSLTKPANCTCTGRTRTDPVTIPQESVCDYSGSPILSCHERRNTFLGCVNRSAAYEGTLLLSSAWEGCVWRGGGHGGRCADWLDAAQRRTTRSSHLGGKLGTAGQFKTRGGEGVPVTAEGYP